MGAEIETGVAISYITNPYGSPLSVLHCQLFALVAQMDRASVS